MSWSLASWGDNMVNSATIVFFLRVNGLDDVLVTLISIFEFVTIDGALATTSACSPEYGSVRWMIPAVFFRVRRLMPAHDGELVFDGYLMVS